MKAHQRKAHPRQPHLVGLGLTTALSVLAARAAATPLKAVDLDPPSDDRAADDPPPSEEGVDSAAPSETAPITPESSGDTVRLSKNPGRPPPANAEPQPTVPQGQDYQVRQGDTLWDISGTYLQSPWFWPKLWSYNPQIANPHWIYPGNEIHFYPGGAAQVSDQSAPAPSGDSSADEAADVQATGRIGYLPTGSVLVQTQGFITRRELQQAGEVVGSPEEKGLLSFNDNLYMRFDRTKPRPGDELVVFRRLADVHHPVSGDLVGYMTVLLGTVKVTVQGKPLVTGRVDKSFDTIERGDLVGPWGEKYLRNVALKDNERTVGGFVIATLTPELLNIGEHHYVFLDRGRKDGVEEGNTFDVLEKRDGLEEDYTRRWVPGFPQETIGKLLVVDTKETTSEALVINSVRELLVGDHIQMLAQQR